jgi:signal transduction histidine kinase
MSPLATVSIAWASVFAYLALYYLLLFARRRADREYLAFGAMSAALAIYTVGSALDTDATDVAEGTRACIVQWSGVTLCVGFYVEFVHRVLGLPARRAVRLAYAWSLLGLAANLSGLFFDPATPAPVGSWGFDWAPTYHEPELCLAGLVWACGALVLIGHATVLLARHGRGDRDSRILLATTVLWVLGGAHDTFVHATAMRSIYVLEHVGVVSSVAMSWILLGRFVRTSEDLEARTRELHESYNDLRHTQAELLAKEQLAAVGELSAVIAHEVRNPLAIIKNAVSGLRRRGLRDEDRDVLLGILDEETERLNRLVTDLLAFARPVTPQSREVLVAELVSHAIELARAGGRGTDAVALDVHFEDGPTHLACDPDLLRQALVNIAENALQAMPGGGTLTVRVGYVTVGTTRSVALTFRDTGEGMDTLVRSKARDPFFTTRPSGTGLGLAIVDRIARAHGGTVEIESGHGVGTTVTLSLPERRMSSIPPRPAAS